VKLHGYQSRALAEVRRHVEAGRRKPLIVMPTGGGKTCTAAEACREHVHQGGRVLWVAHRRELIKQAAGTLARYDLRVGSFGLNGGAPVQVESIQSLTHPSRREVPPATLVVVDEAHHLLATDWGKIAVIYADCFLLGLTATPERSDGRPLGDVFDALVVAAQVRELIALHDQDPRIGLVPCDVVRPERPDGTPWILRSDEVAQTPLEAYVTYANNERAVVFAPNVPAAREFAEMFEKAGIRADIVHSKMPKDERDSVLTLFERGEIRVVCNVNVLCLDEETEILTARGWVGIDGMQMQDRVANWEDGRVTFEKPKEIVRRKRGPDERMVSLNSPRLSIRVTEGHRMLYRTKRDGQFLKTAARDLTGRRVQLPVSGMAEPLRMGVVTVPKALSEKPRQMVSRRYHVVSREGYTGEGAVREAARRVDRERAMYHADPAELSLDECTFTGFFVADGTVVYPESGGVDHQITLTDKYPKIIQWMDELVSRLELDARRNPYTHNGYNCVRWSFPRGTGGGSQERRGIYKIQPFLDKNGSAALWGLDEKQFDAFLFGLWMANGNHGDGTPQSPKRSRLIHSTNREFLSLVQAIATVRGYGTRLFTLRPREPHHLPPNILALRKKVAFSVGNARLELEPDWRDERVWCVRTRTKNIITRRRGTVVVMGNTEGWDDPGCSVCIIARGCEHAGLYIQMVGRVMRPAPGKTKALLIDLRGVSYIHGLPASDRKFELFGVAIKEAEVTEEKSCALCKRILEGGLCPNPECPNSQKKEGTSMELRTPYSVDAPLVHVGWDEIREHDTAAARVARLAEWLRDARRGGERAQTAVVKYKGVYGFYPSAGERRDAMLLADVGEDELSPS